MCYHSFPNISFIACTLPSPLNKFTLMFVDTSCLRCYFTYLDNVITVHAHSIRRLPEHTYTLNPSIYIITYYDTLRPLQLLQLQQFLFEKYINLKITKYLTFILLLLNVFNILIFLYLSSFPFMLPLSKSKITLLYVVLTRSLGDLPNPARLCYDHKYISNNNHFHLFID